LSGCTSGGSDGGGGGSSDLTFDQIEITTVTDAAGQAHFPFDIGDSQKAFNIEVSSAFGQVQLDSVIGPAGQELITAENAPFLTSSIALQNSPNVVRFPFLTGAVSSGRYTAHYSVVNGRTPMPGANAIASVVAKQDGTGDSGVLRVNMVLVGPVTDANDARESLESAVTIWAQIYGRIGITLDVKWYDYAGTAVLPNPAGGDIFYDTLSRSTREGAINVVVGSEVRGTGTSGSGNRYGISGGFPGSALPGPRSAVALSVLRVTAGDGRFDFIGTGGNQGHNDETRLAAEELARLAANYLGLPNTVIFGGGLSSRVTSSDFLPDSPGCLTYADCRNDKSARTNLMFPEIVEKLPQDRDSRQITEYYGRDQFSAQQREVLNGSVLVK